MTDEKNESPEVAEALESFDLKEWLSGSTNPKTTVTVYRDGETLENLKQLTNHILQAKAEANIAQQGSIAEENGIDLEELDKAAHEKLVALRAKLDQSGLTFHLAGFPQVEQQLITKKVAKSLKGRDATETEPEVPAGDRHPDYPQAVSNAYLARAIEKVVLPSGVESDKKWTADEVKELRSLPAGEFARLEQAAISVVYMQYDVDTLIDQDF